MADYFGVLKEESLGELRVLRARLDAVIERADKAANAKELNDALWDAMNVTDETQAFKPLRNLRDRAAKLG